jgi:hypothetical protein
VENRLKMKELIEKRYKTLSDQYTHDYGLIDERGAAEIDKKIRAYAKDLNAGMTGQPSASPGPAAPKLSTTDTPQGAAIVLPENVTGEMFQAWLADGTIPPGSMVINPKTGKPIPVPSQKGP